MNFLKLDGGVKHDQKQELIYFGVNLDHFP